MNNRYRNAPGLRGPSKASATTQCQKCLKRDTYECKVSNQDRPYLTRPSRTQQLQNPNLKPKLSSDVPNDLLRTKGLADELLEKREEERGRKRDQDEFGPVDGQSQPKRARSESSHSMSSVSTISTNRSRSRSPSRRDSGHQRKRRYSASSNDDSISSYSSGKDARSRSREWTRERNTRRRRQESSPGERGRRRHLSKDGDRKYRSPNRSRDRGEIARGRRSMSPNATGEQSHYRKHSRERVASHENRSGQAHSRRPRHQPDVSGARPPRERSLSPFSKRLALTQAMNMGN